MAHRATVFTEFPMRIYAVIEDDVVGEPFIIVESALDAIDDEHAGAYIGVYRLESVKILEVDKELRDR